MCGIFAIFSSSLDPADLRKELIKCSSKLRHRGPDWSGYMVVEKEGCRPLNHGIAHERLAIMDPESGEQPLVSRDGNIIVAANGEIYNYKEIYHELSAPYTPKTGSDCEVMLPLWSEHDGVPTPDLPNKLRGMFSVIMYDKSSDTYFIFRDHIGKTPLYIGWGNDGSVYVASEMKSLVNECSKFQNFPPGHCYSNKGPNAGEFVRWYKPNWAPEMKPGLPPPKDKFQEVRFLYPICLSAREFILCQALRISTQNCVLSSSIFIDTSCIFIPLCRCHHKIGCPSPCL